MRDFHALWWRLSGPAGFTGRCVSILESGECLLVGKPSHAPADLDDAISDAIERLTYLDLRVIALYEGDPLAQMSEQLGLGQLASIDALVGDPRLGRTVFHLVGRGAGALPVGANTFAHRFIAARRRAATSPAELPRLWVDLQAGQVRPDMEGVGADGEYQCVIWRGYVRRGDMAAYVAALMNGRPGPGPWRLYEAIVRQFAEFDRDFADQLALMPATTLMHLPNELRALAEKPGTRQCGDSWLEGGQDVIDCARRSHAMADARRAIDLGDPKRADLHNQALFRRLWRAQLEELLPWIEENRLAGIRKHASVLEPLLIAGAYNSFGDRLDTLNDIDFNDACYLIEKRLKLDLRGFPLLAMTRAVRNDLAHQDVVVPNKIELLLKTWQRDVPEVAGSP